MTNETKPIDMTQGFTITRLFDAPRDLVWQAWTDPDELARWYQRWLQRNGATTPCESVQIDLRVGGRYRYDMVPQGTGEPISTGGEYLEIREPERLVFTWGYPDAPVAESPLVTVTFAVRGDQTEMTFQLQGAPGQPGDNFMYDGWTATLDALSEHVTEPAPTPAPRGRIRNLDHVSMVVNDLDAAKAFFADLGMEFEGEAPIAGDWVDRINNLDGVRVDIAMMRTPDGQGRLELTKFHHPAVISPQPENLRGNALGLRSIMFTVDDMDAVVAGLRERGVEFVGTVEQYENYYKLVYVRGPEGIIVALSEQLF